MEEGGRGLGVATEEMKWLEKVSKISCGLLAQVWSQSFLAFQISDLIAALV